MAGILDAKMYEYNLRASDYVASPVIKGVVHGEPGEVVYSYKASFVTNVGETLPSEALDIQGNSILSSVNFIRLSVEQVPAEARLIRIWKKNDGGVFKLLGTCNPSINIFDDKGGALGAENAPVADTSGRPEWRSILWNHGKFLQRPELQDFTWMYHRDIKNLGDKIHKNGDIIEGLVPTKLSGLQYRFLPGTMYLDGQYVRVPGGIVTLTGNGTEKVGIVVSPRVVTHNEDDKLRNIDEKKDSRYEQTGADRLVYDFTWGIDQNGQILVQEFIDGEPKKENLAPERSELDIYIADKIRDFAGEFVVEKFPMAVEDYEDDPTKLKLIIKKGKAYPNGFKTVIEGERSLIFEKARDYARETDATLDAFNAQGSSQNWIRWEPNTVYASGAIVVVGDFRYEVTDRADDFKSGGYEPNWPKTSGETVVDNNLTWTCCNSTYFLNGLTLTVKSGEGNTHTVTFTNAETTPALVAAKIESVVNASAIIVDATSSTYLVGIRTIGTKSLTLGGTALTKLGWKSGTTTFDGTRVYHIGSEFVKGVAEGTNETLSYLTEMVTSVTRSNLATKDFISSNLAVIVGAADSEANCHDGIFDYTINSDFIKEGDYIQWQGLSENEPPVGHVYYVKWLKQHVATRGTRVFCNVVDAKVVRGTGDADNLSFVDATIRDSKGNAVSLTGIPKDVIRIVSVNSAAVNGGIAYSGYTFISNSDAHRHGNAQIGWAGVSTKPAPGATYFVSFEIWYHESEGDYVAANSYDVYDRIGIFGDYTLRDCVDFRTNTNFVPIANAITTLDFSYYLPRIDKLMLDDMGNFYLIKGVPGVKPTIPNDQVGRLSLAILRIAPYTYTKDWVHTISVEPVAVKQPDFIPILKRLDNLEYWKATTDLEQEVANSDIASDAVNIYTNALTGVGKFDLNYRRTGRVDNELVEIKHTAAIDINKQCLLLPATPDMRSLKIDFSASTGIKRVGNTLMIDYEPELFLEQPYATDSVNLAMDFDYDSYRGTANIFPASDAFIDTEQLPSINIDFDNNLQPLVDALVDQGALSLNETVWSNWNTSYTNRIWNTLANTAAGNAYWYDPNTGEYQYGNFIYGWGDVDQAFETYYANTRNRSAFIYRGQSQARGSTTQRRWRDGIQRTLIPGTMTESLGTSVHGLAMTGKVRTKYPDGKTFYIQVEVQNLMPNQDHAIRVAGKVVNFVHGIYPEHPSPPPTRGASGTNGFTFGGITYTTVKSDNTGRLTGYFAMPEGVDAGNVPIEVFHYSSQDSSNASVYFSSAGYVVQQRETTIGMPTFSYNRQTFHEEETRTVYHNYYDPLAQTFVIYERTRYISEVDVFFRKKDMETDPEKALGVRLEVRNTVNGEPGPVILAQSRREAADINISEDGTAATRFELDSVLGYSVNGEFSLVLFPDLNNTLYEVWTAKVGNIDVKTGIKVQGQTNDGVLFHSPNNRVWEPMTKQDLKFRLYSSNFVPECSFVFQRISGIQAGVFVTAVQEFAAAGTDVKWYYSTDGKMIGDNSKTWLPFYPNIDTYMSTLITLVDLKCDVSSLGGSYQMINPESGIVFMLHKDEAWAVMPNSEQDNDLYFPNTVKCYLSLDGNEDVDIKPYFSWDDGESLVEIERDPTFTPSWVSGKYYKQLFSTPGVTTIETASNATPVVIQSTNHPLKENALVEIAGVTGNDAANGTFVIRDVTENSFSLYHPVTKTAIVGTGNGTGGTVKYAEMEQCRPFLRLITENQVRTPRIQDISFVLSQV